LADRVADSTQLKLNGATFNLIGGAGVGLNGLASSETIGTINLIGGNSTVNTTAGSLAGAVVVPTVQLNSPSLTRSAGATVAFTGTNQILGTPFNKITFQSAPATVGSNGGVLPYATASGGSTPGGDFATYDVNNNTIAPFGAYAGSLASAGANDV